MEIKEANKIKRKALSALRRVDLDKLPIDATDSRLRQYVEGVRDNPDLHNLYEVLSVVRYCKMLKKHIWDAKKVQGFIKFYESLKFNGVDGRRSYRLTPVQVFQFANIFGFRKADGTRLIREVILFVPRKFSKTTSAASLAVYEMLFGDSNAQSYIGANSYAQAQICFKEIRKLVEQLDPQKRYFKKTREHIEWKPNKFGKESSVDCLTGGAETKDGLSASLVIMDEYAQARYVKEHSVGAELLSVLRSSMGVRREPLTMIITTASRVPDSPFTLELDAAKDVLLGKFENDTLFASLFMPDEGDDLSSEITWKKCNPHIGVTVQPDYYAQSWMEAQANEEKMIEFKTKLLNVFAAESIKDWIPRALIEKQTQNMELTERWQAMCAIDLSVSDDFSAVSYVIYRDDIKQFHVISHYLIPEKLLETHPNRMMYREWVNRGYLQTCSGEVIDYSKVIDDIFAMNEKVKILQIGYDSYKSQEVINALAGSMSRNEAERVLVPVKQTWAAFTSPVETFEMAIKRTPSAVTFEDNPIQRYCFGNAYLSEDNMENKKPVKKKFNAKIDSVITTLMCFKLWNDFVF